MNNGAFIDEIELNNYNEKLRCLKNIQSDNSLSIKKDLSKIPMYYNTSNTNSLINKLENTSNDLDIVQVNLNKYINIIEKKIASYQLLARETKKKFNNINGGVISDGR